MQHTHFYIHDSHTYIKYSGCENEGCVVALLPQSSAPVFPSLHPSQVWHWAQMSPGVFLFSIWSPAYRTGRHDRAFLPGSSLTATTGHFCPDLIVQNWARRSWKRSREIAWLCSAKDAMTADTHQHVHTYMQTHVNINTSYEYKVWCKYESPSGHFFFKKRNYNVIQKLIR